MGWGRSSFSLIHTLWESFGWPCVAKWLFRYQGIVYCRIFGCFQESRVVYEPRVRVFEPLSGQPTRNPWTSNRNDQVQTRNNSLERCYSKPRCNTKVSQKDVKLGVRPSHALKDLMMVSSDHFFQQSRVSCIRRFDLFYVQNKYQTSSTSLESYCSSLAHVSSK